MIETTIIQSNGPEIEMQPLTSAQRKELRSLAHHLKPLILVGKQGVGDALIAATNEALEDHELIKIRFNEFKDEKKALAEKIANETNSEIAGIVGHVATLYRQQEDPEKRKIRLH